MTWAALADQSSVDAFADATVVVVDDRAENVALLQQLLRRAGVRHVQGFTDPRLALAQVVELDPDLVLLDFHMPELDGRAFLEQLHGQLPEDHYLPVLVITADVGRHAREQALGAGANDFLTKPIDADEALLRSRNLLHTRRLHAQLARHRAHLERELAEATERARHEQQQHARLTAELDAALAGGLPRMVFQPVVDLGSGALVGVEALARFPGPPARSPDEVFACAELLGRTVELEMRALRQATAQLDALPTQAFLSINVSPQTVTGPELHELLLALPRERLLLELTEHTQVEDYRDLAAALAAHREAGMRLAIDDTGAGYASFHHLLQLRPDVIKLDIGLTQGIHRDPARRALGVALVAFAEEVGATIIAEGIEEEGELTTLQELRVPWGQGYYLGAPGPLAVTV